MSASILVVDDEESILTSLSSILQDEGYEVTVAKNGAEALRVYTMDPPDLMLLDIWMPEMDGMETLRRVRELVPTAQVMMMSGHGSIETAVKAIKLGAYDYIEKPLSLENVTLRVKHALDQYRLEQENRTLRTTVQRKFELVGQSPVMQQLRQLIETAGPTNSRVLIGGENGTGKELVARAIHLQSARANRPFVAVNCAAIPETLIESELFGHEKGSFTGATSMKRGQFEQADGGTLFLDEIADMSLSTQAKVLRALQEQQFTRVGGTKLLKVDVRVLAASNKDLIKEIEKGTFREDLFYRLNVVPIIVPPLRERREDHPAAHSPLHEGPCGRAGVADERDLAGGDGGVSTIRLAGKHSRIAEPDRTIDDHGAGTRHRSGASGPLVAGAPGWVRIPVCSSHGQSTLHTVV